MRTTIQALVALLGSSSLLAQSTNVYSLNAVGYVNITCQQGFTLFGYPLFGSPNNDLIYSIDNTTGSFNGCQIFFWQNGIWTSYIANTNPTPPVTATNGWVEPNGPMMLPPGAGAAFYNPNSAVTLTLVGTVPSGSLTNTLYPGLNLVSSILPAAGDLSADTLLTFPSSASGRFDGDQLFLYFNSGNGRTGYTMFTVDSLNYNPPGNYGWDGLPRQPDPVTTEITQAFWYRAGNGVVQWTENFSVDMVAPSDSVKPATSTLDSPAIRRLDAAGRAVMLQSRHFQFTLTGRAGKSHVVEASSDLKSWQPVGTNFCSSGKFTYTDPLPATNKTRFYRAFALP
ncbi:MAG TPA: hypothetical protein VMR33_02305 [Candidatus Baltobacteraceae bacterium]|jgi:hypothetical protein|nr:hypothetical protein [Candidatus Baltobacteraceae bacterium]